MSYTWAAEKSLVVVVYERPELTVDVSIQQPIFAGEPVALRMDANLTRGTNVYIAIQLVYSRGPAPITLVDQYGRTITLSPGDSYTWPTDGPRSAPSLHRVECAATFPQPGEYSLVVRAGYALAAGYGEEEYVWVAEKPITVAVEEAEERPAEEKVPTEAIAGIAALAGIGLLRLAMEKGMTR